MNAEKITAAAAWLQDQTKILPFGEVSVKIIMHAGQIRRVEKIIMQKEQDDGCRCS